MDLSVLQSRKTVAVHLKSKQLMPFGLADLRCSPPPPDDTRHWSNVVLLLDQCLVLAGMVQVTLELYVSITGRSRDTGLIGIPANTKYFV